MVCGKCLKQCVEYHHSLGEPWTELPGYKGRIKKFHQQWVYLIKIRELWIFYYKPWEAWIWWGEVKRSWGSNLRVKWEWPEEHDGREWEGKSAWESGGYWERWLLWEALWWRSGRQDGFLTVGEDNAIPLKTGGGPRVKVGVQRR